MSADLLLEIGTEEIPSLYLPALVEQIRERTSTLLSQARLACAAIIPMGTPRRITLWVKDLAETQESLRTKVFGPPRQAAMDASGRPTQAAVGFARGQGVPVDALQVESTPKGDYVFVLKEEKGRPSREVLAGLLPQWISSLFFPKTMRWGDGSFRFVRPVHWILALLGPEVIPFEIDGIRSGNQTYGHRFLSRGPVVVSSPDQYLRVLRDSQVIVDPEERRKLVARQVLDAASREGGTPLEDEGLLNTVTFLVEIPTAIAGHFKPQYLSLPKEVLITAMVKHQRYFPVENPAGELLPCFVAVANTATTDPQAQQTIRAGNERVLQARLADASFFFQEDTRKPLEGYLPGLARVVFQEKLGTLQEKVSRIASLVSRWAVSFAEDVKKVAVRAAQLCKADLLSQMVYEFPELQGVMGREYARKSGEREEVALAIFEHYLPRFPGDQIPKSAPGCLVGLADRLDTLVGYFGVGLVPSGSEDPFALRRQAQGIIAILQGGNLRLDLGPLLKDALDLLKGKITAPGDQVREDVVSFLRQRLFGNYMAQGHPSDVVNAVLAAGWSDLVPLTGKIDALSRFKTHPEFEALFLTSKRLLNITRSAPPPAGQDLGQSLLVREDLFVQPEERELFDLAMKLGNEIQQEMGVGDFAAVLDLLRQLRGPVDRFFTAVMVMVEDQQMKQNRLALLRQVAGLFAAIADFSQLVLSDPARKGAA
ncbi:MAG: glycine--tRNA ligase subunit beta [Candidatus Tectomicrobia bacterium]|uniref:Glycine--tRNA ligase beta subunit n=1 Tax=Tectimicrobiota bacterium TaxID=2528274 RepID=A0A932LYU0_UNCTE|nr:glycine--tRNA ligase subunit beta [Candidatus Tectomicrobia bacterium]